MDHYFIDGHCHLHEPWFDNESIPSLILKAKENNVRKLVNCSSDPSSFDQVIRSSKYKEITITLGLQPTLAKDLISSEPLQYQLDKGVEIHAIGEVGLDYYWVQDDKLRIKQKLLFQSCIQLANEFQLPIVIHSRKAEAECLDVLEKYATTPVLLHSFEGNLKLINRAIDLNYLISIPTNVVIRKNRRKVALRAGLENIILETDAPFCPPALEIKPNTPATIPIAANKLAEIFDCSVEEVAKITTKNAENFYHI
ncbi:MAG: TatD family hydrolase [Candidatus Kariarchaeaceae archaeon]|jgi:TatD DNase family protein